MKSDQGHEPPGRAFRGQLLLFLPLLLLLLLFWGILFGLPPQYGDTYLAVLQDKTALLSRPSEKKRIIVLGGSAVAFGQRSDLLEAELKDYTVINFGLYGGLGTSPMLDLAEGEIREGDLVIISPEQNAQTLSGFFGARAMWQASDGKPALLLRLRRERRASLLGEALPFAAEKFSFFANHSAPGGDGVYARDRFNAWGDVRDEGREGNGMPGGADPDMPVRFESSDLSSGFVKELNDFAAACRKKGAQAVYRFCPMNAQAISPEEAEKIDTYETWLADQLSFPILGFARESILDSVWFFDTNFHLNAAGARLNTICLARQLKAFLGLPGEVSIPVPDAPSALLSASGAEENADGFDSGERNADADCFDFEERNGEARLTGLKARGRAREKLVLPDEMDGMTVTSFALSVFAGNTAIREITVPASVRRIENGSFDGCTGLERVILRQESPGKITVGADLLQGTDCLLVVPASAYSLYLTNYFWSAYAGRIQPDEMPEAEEALVSDAEAPPAGEASSVSDAEALPAAQDEAASVSEPDDETLPAADGVMYVDANGGVSVSGGETRLAFPISFVHLRTNTPLGQTLFSRDGYVPLCWNTEPDGSGQAIPFGSRTDSQAGRVLYMTWVRQTAEADLIWEEREGEARITGFRGRETVLALPETLGGKPVTHIAEGAFAGARIETAVLPSSLFAVGRNAFEGCTALRELWLYDSLFYVYDESFSGCKSLTTLHLSAATRPRYAISYYAAFADKLDWLRVHVSVPKIVMAGGSATRYAYDSEELWKAFPDYTPVNMGVFAYNAMLPQYRMMQAFMGAGDILLSAPEFDTVKTQFCVSNALDDRFWPMTEADYSCVELLDLRQYIHVFSSLADYLHARRMMTGRSYEESPRNYDDDGNPSSAPTYNQYGDYTLPRRGGDRDEMLQTYRADYTVGSFPEETVEALNRVYGEFRRRGVQTVFVYAPRNHAALTAESTPEARAELEAWLREKLAAPMLISMEDSLYPAILFYLIDNHLSDEGVRLHMQKVIPALQNILIGP